MPILKMPWNKDTDKMKAHAQERANATGVSHVYPASGKDTNKVIPLQRYKNMSKVNRRRFGDVHPVSPEPMTVSPNLKKRAEQTLSGGSSKDFSSSFTMPWENDE